MKKKKTLMEHKFIGGHEQSLILVIEGTVLSCDIWLLSSLYR